MKKRKLNIKGIFKILRLVFIILILVSIIKVFLWTKDNRKNKSILKRIDNSVITNKDNKNIILGVDFNKLKKENKNTIGYLKVKGTKINYPIVKYTDNDYYLNHSFDDSKNNAGWIFMNYKNKSDFSDQNITIFGHARLDGSMFGTLKGVLEKEWQNDKSNKTITLITEKGNIRYKVFSTYKIKAEDYYIQPNYTDYGNFLKIIKERSNYDYKVDLTNTRQVLTLSTCDTNENYRIVLHARRMI